MSPDCVPEIKTPDFLISHVPPHHRGGGGGRDSGLMGFRNVFSCELGFIFSGEIAVCAALCLKSTFLPPLPLFLFRGEIERFRCKFDSYLSVSISREEEGEKTTTGAETTIPEDPSLNTRDSPDTAPSLFSPP